MDLTLGLPEAIARCISPAAPSSLCISIAKGAVPLPPVERITAVCALMMDKREEVRAEARTAWDAIPSFFFKTAVVDPSLSGDVLDLISALKPDAEELILKILDHSSLLTRTVKRFIGASDDKIISRIATNHRLLDKEPSIVASLLSNANLHPAERSRLITLYGAMESEPEKPNPMSVEDFSGCSAADEAETSQPTDAPDGPLKELPQELLNDDSPAEKQDSQNIYQLVQTLTVAEKLKLAMLGGKTARRLLLRDNNRMISTAVMRNPKMGEDEVQVVAQDRTVSEDILRIIMVRKDWMKCYPIRVALCNNPKTPLPKALRLLDTIQERDLRLIAKSKNIPTAVASKALRILATRGKA